MENNIIPTTQTETSDESIHALQEHELEQWIIDIIEERNEPNFWWIY